MVRRSALLCQQLAGPPALADRPTPPLTVSLSLHLTTAAVSLHLPLALATSSLQSGPLDPALVKKLGANLSAAQRALGDKAQSTSSADASVAGSLFDADSPLFAGLSGDELTLAEGLARTMQVGFGVPLESASLKWFGYEGASASFLRFRSCNAHD